MNAAGEGAAIIRALRPQDSRLEVSAIYEESWRWAYRGIAPQAYLDALPPGRWAAFIDTPGIYTLVADDGGALAGTASFCASRFPEYEGMGEIVSLYLREPYAGRGLGRALLEAAAAALAAQGFEDIFLWVLEENACARRFYERAGFAAAGEAIECGIGGKTLRELRYVRRGDRNS